MINSAKILKLCNDIEDIVTDMDVHCTQAGWAECMEIFTKIKQIGEELKETQARWIFIMSDEWSNVFRCSNCSNVCTTELFEHSPIDAERFWCSRCGAKMRRAEE